MSHGHDLRPSFLFRAHRAALLASAGADQPPGRTSSGAPARGACLTPGQTSLTRSALAAKDSFWPNHSTRAKLLYARAALTHICDALGRARGGRRDLVWRAAALLASYVNVKAFDQAEGLAMIRAAAAQCADAQRDDLITPAEVTTQINKGLKSTAKAREPKHKAGKASSAAGQEWSLGLLAFAASTLRQRLVRGRSRRRHPL